MNTIPLYNSLGFSTAIDQLGYDWRVCEAARHSYGDASSKGVEADTKLIEYLMSHRHTSPFEQCSITWNLRMPIFVMRQFVRHRTFRLNEESARYTEMREDFYIPSEWRSQATTNKQSSALTIHDTEWHEFNSNLSRRACQAAYKDYQRLLELGVAREQARMILPVNLMTTIVVNIDLHNLMHFFVLRLDTHAQLEIRAIASAMFYQFQERFPVVANAFVNHVLRPKGIAPLELSLLNQ